MNNFSLGPTGGHGGNAFEDYILPDGARIREIHVSSGWYVDSIQFIYMDTKGQPTRGHASHRRRMVNTMKFSPWAKMNT